MLDIGWSELLLIGIVALIVVGPKDLPILFRKAGQFMGKARGMAREFSRAMEQAADEAGVKDVTTSLKASTDPKKMGLDKLNEATESFRKWQPGSETAKLAEDRAVAARKIHEATAQHALKKKAEAEAVAAKSAGDDPGAIAAADPAPKPASGDSTT